MRNRSIMIAALMIVISSALLAFQYNKEESVMTHRDVVKVICTLKLSGVRYAYAHPVRVERELRRLTTSGARVREIGRSVSEQWPMYGVVVGTGQRTISVVAGTHAEEPAGTLAALALLRELTTGSLKPLARQFRWVVVPQANPDGFMANWSWIQNPTPAAYLGFSRRDRRALDVERGLNPWGRAFSRPESEALARFWKQHAPRPYAHVTLHTNDAEGTYLMSWNENPRAMRLVWNRARAFAQALGLRLRDEDLNGAGGYRLLNRPGIYGVPRADAMEDGVRGSTVEFMAGLGARIGIVTEVGLITLDAVTDDVIPGRLATEYLEAYILIAEQAVRERETLLRRLQTGDLKDLVTDRARLAYERAKFAGMWSKQPAGLRASRLNFADKPMLRRHEVDLAAAPHEYDLKLAATAVAVLAQGSARNAWQQRMNQAYARYANVTRPRMTPLPQIIRYMLGVVASTLPIPN